MTTLAVLNSSLTVHITIQSWSPDNSLPLVNALVKKGFQLIPPSPVQQIQGQIGQIAFKGTTTALLLDNQNRRITLQITNENTSPANNIDEVLDILSSIGFPKAESVERIDIIGNFTIKLENDESTFSYIPKIIDKRFHNKIDEIFGRELQVIGVRISTTEHGTAGGASKSPYLLLIEPLYTDDSESKIFAQLAYFSNNSTSTVQFVKDFYGRLKKTILALKEIR